MSSMEWSSTLRNLCQIILLSNAQKSNEKLTDVVGTKRQANEHSRIYSAV